MITHAEMTCIQTYALSLSLYTTPLVALIYNRKPD